MSEGNGKTALITGASTGIGRELAFVFAENGYDLIVVARSTDKLDSLKEELYSECAATVEVVTMDLTKATAPAKLFSAVNDLGIHVDVLVNNAGLGSFKAFDQTGRSRITDMMRLNVSALTELTHLFVQPMIERGEGRILNVASVASFNPTAGAAVYGATKAFVLSLSEALSEELSEHNVTVTALCPGLTETEFSHAATGQKPAQSPVPDMFKLSARKVAEEGYAACHSGQVVCVNGLPYQLGVEWLKYQPRAVARMFGGMFTRQLESGF